MSVFGQGFDGSTRFSGTNGYRVRSVTAAYTISKEEDFLILANNAGGITVTLPPAADCHSDECGMVFWIVNVGAAGTITVDGDGAETINGSATAALATQYAGILLQSTGSAWVALNDLQLASATDLTLTGDLSVGDDASVTGDLTVGLTLTVTGATTLDDTTVVDLTPSGDVDLSGANSVTLAAGEIDSADIAAGAVDAAHMASTRFRSVAADGALTLAVTDRVIELVGSTAAAKAATMTATQSGHLVDVVLEAASGGSYTLACDHPSGTSGTVTLDAAGEGVRLAYSGTAWIAWELVGGAGFA